MRVPSVLAVSLCYSMAHTQAAGSLSGDHNSPDTQKPMMPNPKAKYATPLSRFSVVTVHIGSPRQPFVALIDIGMPDLLVASSKCTVDSWCKEATNRYNALTSETSVDLNEKNKQQYDGLFPLTFKGDVLQDTVTLAGLKIEKQSFSSAYSVKDVFGGQFDAVLGLDMPRPSSQPYGKHALKHPSLWKNIMDNKLLERNVMSLKFGQYVKGKREEEPGELVLGEIDPNYTDSLINMPVSDVSDVPGGHDSIGTFWHVSAHTLEFDDLKVDLSGLHAAFDAQTSYITLPPKVTASIFSKIGVERLQPIVYPIDCEKRWLLPDLIITLGPHKTAFTISSSDYITEVMHPEEGPTCSVNIDDRWLSGDDDEGRKSSIGLGSAFLSRYYSVFDFDSHTISLAPL